MEISKTEAQMVDNLQATAGDTRSAWAQPVMTKYDVSALVMAQPVTGPDGGIIAS